MRLLIEVDSGHSEGYTINEADGILDSVRHLFEAGEIPLIKTKYGDYSRTPEACQECQPDYLSELDNEALQGMPPDRANFIVSLFNAPPSQIYKNIVSYYDKITDKGIRFPKTDLEKWLFKR